MLHEYSPPKGILLHLVSRRSAVRHVAHNCSFVGFGKPRGLLSHSGLPRCQSTGRDTGATRAGMQSPAASYAYVMRPLHDYYMSIHVMTDSITWTTHVMTSDTCIE